MPKKPPRPQRKPAAPDPGDPTPGNRRKKPRIPRRPRGKPFPKGNKLGKKFQPGESGNPAGRPPTPPEHEAAFDVLEPLAYQAMEDILRDPLHKDRAHMAEYVRNVRHGKPIERKELTGKDGKDLVPSRDDALEALKAVVPVVPGVAPAEPTEE